MVGAYWGGGRSRAVAASPSGGPTDRHQPDGRRVLAETGRPTWAVTSRGGNCGRSRPPMRAPAVPVPPTAADSLAMRPPPISVAALAGRHDYHRLPAASCGAVKRTHARISAIAPEMRSATHLPPVEARRHGMGQPGAATSTVEARARWPCPTPNAQPNWSIVHDGRNRAPWPLGTALKKYRPFLPPPRTRVDPYVAECSDERPNAEYRPVTNGRRSPSSTPAETSRRAWHPAETPSAAHRLVGQDQTRHVTAHWVVVAASNAGPRRCRGARPRGRE